MCQLRQPVIDIIIVFLKEISLICCIKHHLRNAIKPLGTYHHMDKNNINVK